MKNRKSIIVASILAIGTLTLPMAAQAQSAATAGSTAGAASQAAVIVNSPLTAPVNAAGGTGIGSASIQGGMQNVGVQAGGGQSASTLQLKQEFVSNGSEIPIQAVGFLNAQPGQAQMFGLTNASHPPQITGALLERYLARICKGVSTPTQRGSVVSGVTGQSGQTDIQATFTPQRQIGRSATDFRVPSVSLDLPAKENDLVCAGAMTVHAKHGESQVTISTLDHDAIQFAHGIDGYSHIYLYSPDEVIAGTFGVKTKGKGFGAGASGAGLAGVVATALGLSAGYNDGVTNGAAQMGTTYLVFAVPNYSGSSAIIPSDGYKAYQAKMNGVMTAQPAVTNGKLDAATTKK